MASFGSYRLIGGSGAGNADPAGGAPSAVSNSGAGGGNPVGGSGSGGGAASAPAEADHGSTLGPKQFVRGTEVYDCHPEPVAAGRDQRHLRHRGLHGPDALRGVREAAAGGAEVRSRGLRSAS
jgi:hypothetical protein